jgi:protein arginine kinase
MDKVSRAFGILIHSYRIETRETLNEIGLVKLGVDLGWVEGVTPADLNHLMFHCRRAHLLTSLKEPEIPQDQVPHKRAEFIHATLKNAKLKI